MTMHEFLSLEEEDKLNVIRKDGVYVGKLRNNDFAVVLYQLDTFYIEIHYDSYRRYINKFSCFDSTELLDDYLDETPLKIFV